MTYLLIVSMVVLAVALWHIWANRIETENESDRIVREARARAMERDKSRTHRESPIEWGMATQMQTALDTTSVSKVNTLSNKEALTVSLILADVQQLPIVDTTGVEVHEVDMDFEHWNKPHK